MPQAGSLYWLYLAGFFLFMLMFSWVKIYYLN